MSDIRVVISGEITEEYEGGLYKTIDDLMLGIEGYDRDGVIDVFDIVKYYTINSAADHLFMGDDIGQWFETFMTLRDFKGLKNVEFSIGQDPDEEDEES